MASRIKAINAFRPRIDLGPTVQKQELVRYIADRTGLNEGEVDVVLKELRDAIVFFHRQGRGVRLEGLGTYLPNIDLSGAFDVQHRLDPEIRKALNVPGTFTGAILNRENIGKSPDELVAMWNEAHPDDPVA